MRPDGQIPKWQCGIIKMEIVLKGSLHFLNHFLQSGTFPFYKCSFKNKVLRTWFLIGGGINFFNGHKRSLFPHFMRILQVLIIGIEFSTYFKSTSRETASCQSIAIKDCLKQLFDVQCRRVGL